MSLKHNCQSCMHCTKKNGMLYCKFNHNYPPLKVIDFFGCYDYKEMYINLLELDKEDSNEQKKEDNYFSGNSTRIE